MLLLTIVLTCVAVVCFTWSRHIINNTIKQMDTFIDALKEQNESIEKYRDELFNGDWAQTKKGELDDINNI